MLGRVLQYLTGRRHLPASLLAPLVESGKLYADSRGNAVFLLVAGKANRPVGAELRGTGPRVWRGMAPGSRKDSGYFWIGVPASAQHRSLRVSHRRHQLLRHRCQSHLYLHFRRASQSTLAQGTDRSRLRDPLRLRRRRTRRQRRQPDDRSPPHRPTTAPARSRLERGSRRAVTSFIANPTRRQTQHRPQRDLLWSQWLNLSEHRRVSLSERHRKRFSRFWNP